MINYDLKTSAAEVEIRNLMFIGPCLIVIAEE